MQIICLYAKKWNWGFLRMRQPLSSLKYEYYIAEIWYVILFNTKVSFCIDFEEWKC